MTRTAAPVRPVRTIAPAEESCVRCRILSRACPTHELPALKRELADTRKALNAARLEIAKLRGLQ